MNKYWPIYGSVALVGAILSVWGLRSNSLQPRVNRVEEYEEFAPAVSKTNGPIVFDDIRFTAHFGK